MTAPVSASSTTLESALDSDDLWSRVGGDRLLLTELVEAFARESPGALVDIRRSVESHDATGLQRAAHKLRGALMTLGADRAAQAALALEELGRNGGSTGAVGQVLGLEREIQRLTHELGQLIRADTP